VQVSKRIYDIIFMTRDCNLDRYIARGYDGTLYTRAVKSKM